MTERPSLEDAEVSTKELETTESREVISSEEFTRLHIRFDDSPSRRESQFPGTDYYWSYPVTEAGTGNKLVINSSSKRLKRLVDTIKDKNHGELVGVKGMLIREGTDFDVHFGWIPEEKLGD